MVAEVGIHDTTRTLNVRPGTYFIRERLETHLLEGAIHIAAGDAHSIDDRELARVEYIQVAGKGAIRRERHDAVEAGLLVRTPLVAGGDACTGAIAGYAFDLGAITLTPRLSACRESAHNAFVTEATDDVAADAPRRAHVAQLVPRGIALTAQAEAGGALLHQTFTTTGTAPARTTSAPYFGGGGSIAYALGRGATASIATEVDTFVLRRDAQMSSRWEPTLSLSAVVALGLAM